MKQIQVHHPALFSLDGINRINPGHNNLKAQVKAMNKPPRKPLSVGFSRFKL